MQALGHLRAAKEAHLRVRICQILPDPSRNAFDLQSCELEPGNAVYQTAFSFFSPPSYRLTDNNIDDDGAILIADMLAANSTLRSLECVRSCSTSIAPLTRCIYSLRSNCIDAVGAQAIADALRCNSTLSELMFEPLHDLQSWSLILLAASTATA